jgi:uncharacterized protein (DUF1810 family)
MGDLERFRKGQDDRWSGYASALGEMRAGEKTSHWIWYIFPQLAGLGSSFTARKYGLQGVEEAKEYLRDSELRSRLLTIAEAAASHLRGPSPERLRRLMGSDIDALKLVSSMTLFAVVARQLAETDAGEECRALAGVAGEILDAADRQGYPACAFTLRQLGLTKRP